MAIRRAGFVFARSHTLAVWFLLLVALLVIARPAAADRPEVVCVIGRDAGLVEPRSAWFDAERREIHVADPSSDRVRIFDWNGREVGGFEAPAPIAGCATGGEDLVIEADGARVMRYDARGRPDEPLDLSALPWASSAEARPARYSQVATDPRGQIYLCDGPNRVVVVLSRAGRYVRHFGRAPGTDTGTAFEAATAFCIFGRKVAIIDGGTSRVYVFAQDGEFLFRFGEAGGEPGQLARPSSVASDSRSRLLVLDTVRHCVSAFDERGTYLGEYGGMGESPGWFYFPNALAVDPDDRALVTETMQRRVQVLRLPVREAERVVFERAIGEYAPGQHLDQATSFAWNEARGEILIADTAANRISTFQRDGRFLGSIDRGLVEPVGVAVSASQEIYVTEMASDAIKVFDPRGRQVRTISLAAHARGRPVHPGRMRFDSEGRIFVIDRANCQVLVLTEDGDLVSRFGSRGTGQGQFQMPQDLFLDSEGRIYVVDSDAPVPVQVFSLSGTYLSGFGRHGDSPEDLSSPAGIFVDGRGRIFVTDQFRQTVQVYDASGRLLFRWGGAGDRAGELNGPAGITVTADGSVLVLEKAGGRLSVFRLRAEGE